MKFDGSNFCSGISAFSKLFMPQSTKTTFMNRHEAQITNLILNLLYTSLMQVILHQIQNVNYNLIIINESSTSHNMYSKHDIKLHINSVAWLSIQILVDKICTCQNLSLYQRYDQNLIQSLLSIGTMQLMSSNDMIQFVLISHDQLM